MGGYFGELVGVGDGLAVVIGVDRDVLKGQFCGVFGFGLEGAAVGHHCFE